MNNPKQTSRQPRQRWRQNPEKVRANILRIAIAEFAERGLSGARISHIAEKTETSKRMIYYYFSDKEGLYRAALEEAYARMRASEDALRLEGLPARAALARLVGFTFDHHRENPDFIRLVMIENIHRAAHLKRSSVIQSLNLGVIDALRDICARGASEGSLRDDLDPLQLHWQISALCVFNISNRPTFTAVFGEELWRDAGQEQLRTAVIESVLGYASRRSDAINPDPKPVP